MQCLVGTCQHVSAGCDGCFYFEVLSSGPEKMGLPLCVGGGGALQLSWAALAFTCR